jgi:hypothetical protein
MPDMSWATRNGQGGIIDLKEVTITRLYRTGADLHI